MTKDERLDFDCPHYGASYKVVRIKNELRQAHPPIPCWTCPVALRSPAIEGG
jgi:hypothetical protein